jgi:hypothetical protein
VTAGTGKISPALWDAFGPDWRENCLRWERPAGGRGNPALPPSGAGWKRRWTANPALRVRGEDGALLLYYRGNGAAPGRGGDHDRIGVAAVRTLGPEGLRAEDLNGGSFAVDVGLDGAFDGADVLDPGVVEFDGRVFLYYSAIGAGEDAVGLAVSTDGTRGERFEKAGRVLTGRAPDAVAKDGRVYLLCQRFLPGGPAGRYAFYLFASSDGRRFEPVQDGPVFAGTPDGWDAHSLTTGRLFEGDGGWYYLMYGGSSYLTDEQDCFGLARSRDLVRWERHPGNPVFGLGPRGAPDGGAVWFPALHETLSHFVLLYEGSPGKYSWGLHSAVCLAALRKRK